MKIGIEKREFEFTLTDEERHYRAVQAAALCDEAQRIKADAAKLSADVTRKTKEMQQLLAVHRTGTEARSVECEVCFVESLQEVLVLRRDTGEAVDKRKPTEEDWHNIDSARQTEMQFASALETVFAAQRPRKGRKSSVDAGTPDDESKAS